MRNSKRQPTAEQAAKAAERREKFRALAKQIGEMSDAERSAMSAKMIGLVTVEGHHMSAVNCCLIYSQMPDATVVGGFRQWLKAGRCVKKGEHGLSIWLCSERKGEEGKPADQIFFMGTIFDVSQTEEHATANAELVTA
jgi:hypothetical protein